MQAHQAQSWMGYLMPIAIFAMVMALRLRNMGRMRPLRLERLWVVPLVYFAVALMMFIQLPPRGWVAIASVAGLAIGAAVGWQRGKMMEIHIDPRTHDLNQKASPAAMIFLLVLIAVRAGAKTLIGYEGNVSPAMLTDPLVAFALGLFALTRLEMYIRAKRMLEEVRSQP